MKPIAPNTLIQNRYLIVHLIGKGGMGEVYLAVDQRLGNAIALKRTFFSEDITLGNAFEREARTLARLRHPVLPKVSDHFTEEGTQYLVMEHISGEDMSKRLETNQKPFPISWVLFWADQLLDGLNYLHSHEPPIIHRDIKPQNLKLTDDNHIVLLDFGLSKNTVGETRVTTAGSIVGYTPHYAPMEQIRGTGTDARSDIYSLSATLYQILTNTVPPDALTRVDNLINGMPDPVTPISDLNPEVSRAVSDVIIRGMTISQEQRYKTARLMQKALRDAYAQLQNNMSASTASAVDASSPADLPQSPQKTVELSGTLLPSQKPATSNNAPMPYDSGALGVETNVVQSPASGNSEPNFDATVRCDSKVPEPSLKQSDIKTEVFLSSSTPAIAAVQEENHARNDVFPNTTSYTSRNKSLQGEDSAAENNLGVADNYSPNVIVPLFSFDKNDKAGAPHNAGFDSIHERGDDNNSAGVTYVPTDSTAGKADYTSTPPPTQKKSSRSLAVAGGLFVLLLLAVGAAGIGWYLLRDKGVTTDNVEPAPTTKATVNVESTAAPTAEVATETNTSTETYSSGANTSTNNEVTTSNTDRNANSTATTRSSQMTVQTTMPPRTTTSRSTPHVVTAKTPATTSKTPVPAKTPKAGRTDILQ